MCIRDRYFFYGSWLAAAKGCPVTGRTFDFGSDRTISDAYQGLQSSKLGLRGIRNSLRPVSYTHLDVYKRQVHEGPHALNSRNTTRMHPGMVVTDEPGVYEKIGRAHV